MILTNFPLKSIGMFLSILRGGAKRENSRKVFFENGRKCEKALYFLLKSEKAVTKFCKAGGDTLPQVLPPNRAVPVNTT
jgi:hypothetical protein